MPIPFLGALAGAGGAIGAGGLPAMFGGGLAGNLATAGLIGGSIAGLSGDPKVRQAGGIGQALSLSPFLFGVGGPQKNPLSTTVADNSLGTLQSISTAGSSPAFQGGAGANSPFVPFGG